MNLEIQPSREPNYAVYQKELFLAGRTGGNPHFNTHPDALEQQAKEALSKGGWLYVACDAGVSWTSRANREALYRWRIVPRMLRDTTARDTTTTLFGHKISAPVCLAPIGINKIYHPVSRPGSGRALTSSELTKSSWASSMPRGLRPPSISLICSRPPARSRSKTWPRPTGPARASSSSTARRTRSSRRRSCSGRGTRGSTSVSSLSTPGSLPGASPLSPLRAHAANHSRRRHNDIANSNYAFYRGIGAEIGLTDPVFRRRLAERGLDPANQADMPQIGELWIDQVWHGKAFTWDKVPLYVAVRQ